MRFRGETIYDISELLLFVFFSISIKPFINLRCLFLDTQNCKSMASIHIENHWNGSSSHPCIRAVSYRLFRVSLSCQLSILHDVAHQLSCVFTSANFIYDGDGKRVKSVMNMGVLTTATYFLGSHDEVANGVVATYYNMPFRANTTLTNPPCPAILPAIEVDWYCPRRAVCVKTIARDVQSLASKSAGSFLLIRPLPPKADKKIYKQG